MVGIGPVSASTPYSKHRPLSIIVPAPHLPIKTHTSVQEKKEQELADLDAMLAEFGVTLPAPTEPTPAPAAAEPGKPSKRKTRKPKKEGSQEPQTVRIHILYSSIQDQRCSLE